MNCIKYIPRFHSKNLQDKYIICSKILTYVKLRFYCNNSALNKLIKVNERDDFWNKIIYNEVLSKVTVTKAQRKNDDDKPIFLKYLEEDTEVDKNDAPEKSSEILNFPYDIKTQYVDEIKHSNTLEKVFPPTLCNFTPSDNEKTIQKEWGPRNLKIDIRNLEKPERWASIFSNDGFENDNLEDSFKFGTCNPNQRVSTAPCGGCGALLQCNDPSIPGFIPAEVFESKTRKELLAEICQRCHFLKEYHVSLGVNVSPSEYIELLGKIKEKEALAILMVDLLDFPCSIFPGILDIIGPTKPLVIVGNKVDLLIQDGAECLKQYKNALLHQLKVQGINLSNIKLISLISAKTGYGVEDLITQLHLNWEYKGDVYLIGCTNVGKSTLFNTLIQSDYCNIRAVNLLQRATISAWPGTTLNLLKFPIMKPIKSRLIARSLRLEHQEKEEAALRRYQWLGQNIKLEQIPLQGYVGKTFAEPEANESLQLSDNLQGDKPVGLDPQSIFFRQCKWFYDTPGVVHKDQIVNILTTSELLLTVPQKMLLPRTFHLKPGNSLFIAGIARLDYISGPSFVWFTVYASMELPVTVTKTEDADLVYKKLLGSPFFRVPINGKERLAKWPDLSSKKFEITAKIKRSILKEKLAKQNLHSEETIVDIVLSSAGWIAVAMPIAYRCNVEVWTPEGRGIYLREYPLIMNGFLFRGNRIPGTPAFTNKMREVKGYSVTDEPPF